MNPISNFTIMKTHIISVILFVALWGLNAQNNLVSNAASYLCTDGVDEVNGVDVAPDGSIVVVGKLYDYSKPGATVYNLLGGGDATVVRLNSSGSIVLSITHIGSVGGTINDVQVADDGRIAITGSFGVGLLKADGSNFEWVDTSIQIGTVDAHSNSFYGWFNLAQNKQRYKRAMSRISIGSDGTTATIQQVTNYGSSYLYVYDTNGTLVFDSIFPATTTKVFPDRTFTNNYNINVYPNDICVDGKNKSIIIAGWNPRMDDSRHMLDHPIHMPYIKCMDYLGNMKWIDYDWRAKDVYDGADYYADSRFNDIVLGRDGYLYTAGYIHGGDHMFILNPKTMVLNNALAVGFDSYSSPYSMGSGIDHAYICQYNAVNGDMIKGEGVLVRKKTNGTDKPNQSQVKGLMADENGKLYLAGYCQPYIKNRALQTINGIAVGAKDTCEAFVMVLNSDWKSREIWTVPNKNLLEGTFWGLGYRNGIVAAAGEVFAGEAITVNAIEPVRKAGYDGYLLAWGNFSIINNTPSAISISNSFNVKISNNTLTVETPNILQILLCDITGKVLGEVNGQAKNEVSLSIDNIPKGIYFVKVTDTNGTNTSRIIIKN